MWEVYPSKACKELQLSNFDSSLEYESWASFVAFGVKIYLNYSLISPPKTIAKILLPQSDKLNTMEKFKKMFWKIYDLKVVEKYLSWLLTTAEQYVARVYSPSRPAYLVPLVSVISAMMFDFTIIVTLTRLSHMYNQSH